MPTYMGFAGKASLASVFLIGLSAVLYFLKGKWQEFRVLRKSWAPQKKGRVKNADHFLISPCVPLLNIGLENKFLIINLSV